MFVCPTEPTVALTLCQVCGYIYNCVRYPYADYILTDNTYIYCDIHTYTHTIHALFYVHAYMHAPIKVGRGLWGAVADATTCPIGWDGAWVRVDKRGLGLGPHPAARGERFRDL